MLDAFKKREINRLIDIYKQYKLSKITKYNLTKQHIRSKILSDDEKQEQIHQAKESFLKNSSKLKLKQKIKEKIRIITGLTRIPGSKPASAPRPTSRPRKKALLIGINYIGTRNQLNGCINDVNDVGNYLSGKGFTIKIMTDLTPKKPYRSTILDEFKNLLQQSKPGDELCFMFSGHGSIRPDKDNNEVTGMDQTIIPLDLRSIIDDELKSIINQYLPAGVTLFALFDSCYSGTVLDLKYQYLGEKITINDKVNETNGNVFMISGCTDKQTSEDAYINNRYNGALTWTFLQALRSNSSNITWGKLLKTMNDNLRSDNRSQTPQFSCGKPTNIDETIRCV